MKNCIHPPKKARVLILTEKKQPMLCQRFSCEQIATLVKVAFLSVTSLAGDSHSLGAMLLSPKTVRYSYICEERPTWNKHCQTGDPRDPAREPWRNVGRKFVKNWMNGQKVQHVNLKKRDSP